MEYYAHYDQSNIKRNQLLAEHLRNVAAAMKQDIPPVVCFPAVNNQLLREIGWWTGYLHDFGKYSDFFQDYLLRGLSSPYKEHAPISALTLHGLLLDILPPLPQERWRYCVAFLAYAAVRCHHGALTIAGLYGGSDTSRARERWETLAFLATHLGKKAWDVLVDAGLQEHLSLTRLQQYLDPSSRQKDERNFAYMPQHLARRLQNIQWYFLLIYMFSLLIDKDKLDTAGMAGRKLLVASPRLVPLYLARKHPAGTTRPLDERRERARRTILERLDSLSDEQVREKRFFTITAPTGIGKTLAALQCALRLQERIRQAEGYTPRLITAIPFINIIEQTRRDYEGVLALAKGPKPRLVVHHSLADLAPPEKGEVQADRSVEQVLLEVEAWEGDVVLTTFVQLFHSLLTANNRMLKKVHKLAGSIVLLDEVQSLPDKYQPLVGALLRKLAEYYGTRFILMTATQPRLLDFGDLLLRSTPDQEVNGTGVAVELLPDYPSYFSQQRRTKLVPLLATPLDTGGFVEKVMELRRPGQSALVVVNTIRRSIEVFRLLQERLVQEPDRPRVLYLSTNIIPRQRRRVIRLARWLLHRRRPVVLVSTQTIEAGVDLDFDMGFRDLAPLESLIQTAGRVNREGQKGEFAPLYVCEIGNDCQHVYAFHHIDRTRTFLQREKEICEPVYVELVQRYYDSLLQDGVSREAKEIWEDGVLQLNFEVLQKFQLISNAGEVVDVFVEMVPPSGRSGRASLLADAYEEIIADPPQWDWSKFTGLVAPAFLQELGERPDPFQRRALLKIIRTQMNDYIIQVRRQKLEKNVPLPFGDRCHRARVNSNLFWVPPSELERYYDQITGFKDESGRAFIF